MEEAAHGARRSLEERNGLGELVKRVAEGNPTFDLAIAGSQLLGARTYSIRDAPQYQAAFERIVWELDDGKL